MSEDLEVGNFRYDLAEINQKIKNEIHENLLCINEKSRNYIKDIVSLINYEIGINKILSIILFGSQRKHSCEHTGISDCDLLFIFKDRVSNRHIREIEKYFIALEIKHKFRDYEDGIIQKILNVIQQTTGMFVSHFLTKRKYWEEAKFHKIFRVNKFVSYIFAPRKIVLCSVIDNSNILYGEDLRNIVKSKVKIPVFDMLKSTVMNLCISIFSLVISPLKKLKPMKYCLEAVKWALRASNYYAFEDTVELEKITRRFQQLEKYKMNRRHAKIFYKRFLDLRNQPRLDLGFMLRTPLRILKIHVKGFIYAKLVGKRK
ncbi:MAG: hypothetical protein ACTSVV_00460 [Promethearchaeota archaeon]